VSPHELVVLVLLALAALVVVLSAVGLVAAPSVLPRLHFIAPVTSLAAPLVGVAYVVDQGIGLAAGLVLLVVTVLALTGPPLGAAIGRLAAAELDLLPAESPQ
jgi:multisubunit Na+/H+ antiporter MnhG subunit